MKNKKTNQSIHLFDLTPRRVLRSYIGFQIVACPIHGSSISSGGNHTHSTCGACLREAIASIKYEDK